MRGLIMSVMHTKPVMMRPQVIRVHVLLVYRLLGCTASQRQVGNHEIQYLLNPFSIDFCSLH